MILVLASSQVIPLLNLLSSTLPMVYVATTGHMTGFAYPTQDVRVEISFASTTDFITEAQALAVRPNALKVLTIGL